MKKTFSLLAVFCLVGFALNAQQRPDIKGLKNRGIYHSLISPEKNAQNDRTHRFSRTGRLPGVDQQVGYKASNLLKQKLDYLTWEMYDEESGSMITRMREEYSYDVQARTNQAIQYTADQLTGEWILFNKTSETYDANGNLLTRIGFTWNSETEQWIPFHKNEYSYDENGRQILFTSNDWDDITQAWIASFKSENTWDAAGNRTLIVDAVWDPVTATWISDYKMETTYDTNGHENQFASYQWDIEANQWIPIEKSTLSYDTKGDLTLEVVEDWDVVTQAWLPGSKNEFTYNSNHQITLYVCHDWEIVSETWLPVFKIEILYDSAGNEIEDVNYNWNETSSQWEYEYKSESTFDLDYLIEEILAPASYTWSFYFNNKILFNSFILWDAEVSQWVTFDRESYFYSDMNNSGIGHNPTTPIQVYPNPANGYITIQSAQPLESANIELFDIQGRRVVSQIVSGNQLHVSVEALSSGLYYYRITQGEKVDSGKLMIR